MMSDDPRVRNILTDDDVLIAQVFDLAKPGAVIFPTPNDAEMQCGFGQVSDHKIFQAHVHNVVHRQTRHTSEFLYVVEGLMTVDILDQDGEPVASISVGAGQGLLQYLGGHRIAMDAGTRYFEIKQGPYLGNVKDKTLLDAVKPSTTAE